MDSGHGDTVTVVSGPSINLVFTARFDVTTIITFEGLTGDDPREQTIMRVLDPPPVLNRFDIVKVTDPFTGETVKWKILRRENNPANVTTDYWVERQLPPATVVPVYTPPPGKKFLTDENGLVLTDENGNRILVNL